MFVYIMYHNLSSISSKQESYCDRAIVQGCLLNIDDKLYIIIKGLLQTIITLLVDFLQNIVLLVFATVPDLRRWAVYIIFRDEM